MDNKMLIRVRVKTGVKKDEIKKIKEGLFEIKVREKREAGMANAKAVKILAGHLGVSDKRIRIIKGAKNPSKILKIF